MIRDADRHLFEPGSTHTAQVTAMITPERGTPDLPRRRITVADVMVLVAAMAPGLILLRAAADLDLLNLPLNPKAPPGRNFIEYLSVAGGSILGSMTFALLVLGLYKPGRGLREIIGGPGFVACAAVVAASVLPAAYFVIGVTWDTGLGTPRFSSYLNNLFARWTHGAVAMIIGASIALALVGRWRPGPTWTDRLGCVLGNCWICIYV
jgi:hypothetical protein